MNIDIKQDKEPSKEWKKDSHKCRICGVRIKKGFQNEVDHYLYHDNHSGDDLKGKKS